jgi:hypothetical protein
METQADGSPCVLPLRRGGGSSLNELELEQLI